MKRVFALATIALLMITSCSDDDTQNTVPVEDNTLLKKTISTFEDGTVITTNYNYDGNKIVSQISSNGETRLYTYTGNLITHETTTIQNNNITIETTIEYNSNNQKISEISLSSSPELEIASPGTKEVYTYNSNGTVTFNQYSGDLESQTTFEGTGTITYNENENTILHEGMSSEAYTHTLDTKNNPMKNILGYNEYTQPHLKGKHNLLTGFTTPTRSIYIFTYTYNSNNYPLTSVDKIYQMNEYVTAQKQYFYE